MQIVEETEYISLEVYLIHAVHIVEVGQSNQLCLAPA